MADFNQNTPRPSTEGPRMSANRGELYAQITAEDEEVVTVAPKKQSHIISLMAVLMKITFHVDAFRRSNERLFIFLHSIWAGAMSVLYMSGIITLFLSVFSFAQLPSYLKDYFEKHGIQYDSLEMPDYSLSKINVTNLKDTNNNYVIPSVTIHSTFADLLQNRIRMLEVNGLKINLGNGSTNDMESLELVLGLLQTLSSPNTNQQDLSINVVRINNASLNIQGQEQNTSVAFSLSGTYMNENQVIIPLSINEDFLRMDALLQITGPKEEQTIELKTTNVAEITFPQRLSEKLEGNIIVQLQNANIQNITVDAKLNHAYSNKTIQLDLENNGQKGYDGRFSFTQTNTNDSSPTTDIVLNIKDLTLTDDGLLISKSPLQLDLKRFTNQFFSIDSLKSALNGQLTCSFKNKKCDYLVQKESTLNVNSFSFTVKNQQVIFSTPSSFALQPTSQKAITLQFKNPYLQVELPFKSLNLNGVVGANKEKLSFNAENLDLIAMLGQNKNDNHLRTSIKNANYSTTSLSMNQMNLFVEDYFNPTAKIQMDAKSVQTSSPWLLKPVSMEISNIGKQTSIKGQIIDTPIQFTAFGLFDPFKSYFTGKFIIPAFDLTDIPFELSDMSDVFSNKISNPSGQFTAQGQLTLTENNISGPFYVGLKDIEFQLDQTQISGLNTVLGLKSLNPLVTMNNQNLFIQNIQTFVPVSNLQLQFQINNQSLRLANLDAQIAGQNVMMSSTLIPLKNPNETLSLRTAGSFDLENLNPYINLSGIHMKNGQGAFNMPVFISNNGIGFGDLTFKISNATWQKQNAEDDILDLFTQTSTGYTVRSGQLILNNLGQADITLDGWLLPNNIKESYGPETIQPDSDLFKQSTLLSVPQEIQNEQNQLFNVKEVE